MSSLFDMLEHFVFLNDNKHNNLSLYFVIVGDLIEKKFQKKIVKDNEKVL